MSVCLVNTQMLGWSIKVRYMYMQVDNCMESLLTGNCPKLTRPGEDRAVGWPWMELRNTFTLNVEIMEAKNWQNTKYQNNYHKMAVHNYAGTGYSIQWWKWYSSHCEPNSSIDHSFLSRNRNKFCVRQKKACDRQVPAVLRGNISQCPWLSKNREKKKWVHCFRSPWYRWEGVYKFPTAIFSCFLKFVLLIAFG